MSGRELLMVIGVSCRWLRVGALGLSLLGVKAQAADARATKGDPARKLYLLKCAKCHKLYDPAKYTDAQWQRWMALMTEKAKIKPEQRAALARYIEETYRHPGNR